MTSKGKRADISAGPIARASGYQVNRLDGGKLIHRIEVSRCRMDLRAILADKGLTLQESESRHDTVILTAIEGFWLAEQRERE